MNQPGTQRPDARELTDWLVDRLARDLGVDREEISPEVSFAELGMPSAKAVELSGDLERQVGSALSPTLLYDHPTVAALVAHLCTEGASR